MVTKQSRCWILLLSFASVVITGTYDTIATKLMNRQRVPAYPSAPPRYFQSPLWQVVIMYLGETLCIFVYSLQKAIFRSNSKTDQVVDGTRVPMPVLSWIFPVTIEFAGLSCIAVAFVYSYASTVQMLRNFNVVTAALLTMAVVRVALRRYQWVGVMVITVGLCAAGLYAVLYPDPNVNKAVDSWIGAVLALVGTGLCSLQFTIEEVLFRKYSTSPLKAIGLEGSFGLVIGIVVLLFAEWMGFESTSQTFYQFKESPTLFWINFSFMISLCIFQTSGLTLSKYGSSVHRVVAVATRSITIYFVEMGLGWNTFKWLNFCSLMILLIGVLIFHGILPPVHDNSTWNKPVKCCPCLKDPDDVAKRGYDEEDRTCRSEEVSLASSGDKRAEGQV